MYVHDESALTREACHEMVKLYKCNGQGLRLAIARLLHR